MEKEIKNEDGTERFDSFSKKNDCINNQKVYNEDGSFIPYSTVINTIEEHKAFCSIKNVYDDSEFDESEDDLGKLSLGELDTNNPYARFNRTPPTDPFIRHQTWLPNGMLFSSNQVFRDDHDQLAKGNYQTVKIKETINTKNFVRLANGDTPSLHKILEFVKPFIKNNMEVKACWRQLAMKCKDLDAFEDF